VIGAPAAVASALASLLEAGEAWPPADPRRLRNLLLDACGSDHRPLVELLLRVGRHGMVDVLQTLGPTPVAAWPDHRTRLVSRACGALYIQPDIAAWAVDAWAVALGVVPASAVASLQREYAARERQAVAERERAEAASALLRPLPGGAPAVASRSGARGGSPTAARAGGVASSGRVGAWRRGPATPSGPPRWRVASAPPPPSTARFLGVLVMGTLALLVMVGAMRVLTPPSPSGRTFIRLPETVGGRAAADAETTPDASDRGTEGDTAGASDERAVDDTGSASDGRTARDTGGASDGRTVRDTGGASDPLAMGDTERTSDGRAPGSARSAAPVDPTAHWSVDPVALGLGGRYAVVHTVHSVAGGDLCRPVEEALAVASRESEEEVVHTAGDQRFALVSRPGVVGRVYPGGAFETVAHRGEHDGVRFVFRMTGRFTPTGFVARSVTQTEALLTYRQLQRCAVMAELTGTRLPGKAP
jgi:hypothetical protein